VSGPRVLIFAYHDVGHACLELLLERGTNVIAVFTHEDDPHEEIWFKSVAALARRHGIPVFTPAGIAAPEWRAQIAELRPDLILSFYYRHMLPETVLALPRLGAFNMHGSLLPKYRGRVPINWAIIHGETETGATLHHMVKRADAGDIVDQERVPIGPSDTARTVFDKVTQAARAVLARQLDGLITGTAPRRRQDETQATYFGGRRPEDGRIDWSQDTTRIFNLIRAVNHPYPGAYTDIDDKRLFIWWAQPGRDKGSVPGEVLSASPLVIATGDGSLEILRMQWQGEAEQEAGAGRHGLRAGQRLATTNVAAQRRDTRH
jgi:methionyl-tRNA formyltransferase